MDIEKTQSLESVKQKKTGRKKRRFIPIAPTKKKFQFKYAGLIVLTGIVPMLVVGAGFYLIFHMVLDTAQLGRYAEEQLGEMFFWLNILLGGVMVISIIIVGFIAIRLSHKIAGPLYRIENSILKMLEGKIFEIKIRKEDELQDLVNLINKLLINKLVKK